MSAQLKADIGNFIYSALLFDEQGAMTDGGGPRQACVASLSSCAVPIVPLP